MARLRDVGRALMIGARTRLRNLFSGRPRRVDWSTLPNDMVGLVLPPETRLRLNRTIRSDALVREATTLVIAASPTGIQRLQTHVLPLLRAFRFSKLRRLKFDDTAYDPLSLTDQHWQTLSQVLDAIGPQITHLL